MVSREDELWASARVLAMHEHGGRCGMCARDGCRMKVWAETIRRQAAAEGYVLPPIAPSWSPEAPASYRPVRPANPRR